MSSSAFGRSAGRRASVLLWLLAGNVVVSAVAALISVWGYVVVEDVFQGTASIGLAETFDSVFAWSGIVEGGVYLAAIVAWLAWLSRTVDNAPDLGFGRPSVSPRWAIAWWFVPFANLVKGYQIVRELYERMRPAATWTTRAVGTWWLLFLVSGVVGNIAGRYWLAESTDTQAELQFGLVLYVWAEAATIASAFAAIEIVRRIQRWADAAAERRPGAEIAGGASAANLAELTP